MQTTQHHSGTSAAAPPADPGLVVSGVSKTYGEVTALTAVDLDIHPGEIVALLGPNGSGKTTLMSVIAGLLSPDTGVLGLDGEPLTQPRARHHRTAIGYSGQRIALYPGLTVEHNLRHLASLARERARPAGVERTIDLLALRPFLSRRVDTLSGGQARRVHVAVATLGTPRLVILDEPSAGVDAESREILIAAVRSLSDDGTAVLYSTHYPQEVEDVDPRIAFLHRGRLLADGALADLLVGRGTQVRVHFDGAPPPVPPGWTGRARVRGSAIVLTVADHRVDPFRVLGDLERADRLRVRQLSTEPPSLRQLYTELVGSADEDDG